MVNKIYNKIKRKLHQIHAYDYSETNGGWNKYVDNPVLGGNDSDVYFDPFVRKIENCYLMCVSNRSKNTIEFYESQNGVDWKFKSIVLECDESSKWEEKVNRACFVKKNEIWYLWYTGQTSLTSRIGLATSTDGINFKRYEKNPIIEADTSFEKFSVMNPCVIWDHSQNLFCMWYAAGENYEPDVICYAESEDGICWKKVDMPVKRANYNNVYERFKVGACDVIKNKNNMYEMAYIAYQNIDLARICFASSNDGIKWSEDDLNPIISPGKMRWDAHAVYKPTICDSFDGKYKYLWYNGRKDKNEYIGLAIKSIER